MYINVCHSSEMKKIMLDVILLYGKYFKICQIIFWFFFQKWKAQVGFFLPTLFFPQKILQILKSFIVAIFHQE